MTLNWRRTADRKAGPGNLLNGRWLVRGKDRYWSIHDLDTSNVYPVPILGDCYYASMGEARREAENLARAAEVERDRVPG